LARIVEQLILLTLFLALILLLVAQGDKAIGLGPAFGLIPELTLSPAYIYRVFVTNMKRAIALQ
jgi:hypothetical protein